jgi:hypothetical protein
MGLPDIGEDAAYRLSLAAELIDAGVAPRELARELGLNPVQFDVSKYDENQPRVPAGSGRESGQWTSGDAAAGGDASALVEGRSAGGAGPITIVPDLPKDAIVVTRPDGTTIDDPDSPTGKLMAPPRANIQEVYAAGERIANEWPSQQIVPGYPVTTRCIILVLTIFNVTRRPILNSSNMFTPQITPLASIWPEQAMQNGSQSRSRRHTATSSHRPNTMQLLENGPKKVGTTRVAEIGGKRCRRSLSNG